MNKTENIPCGIEAAKTLRLVVVRKYGKMKGYFGKEITKAVVDHAERMAQELTD